MQDNPFKPNLTFAHVTKEQKPLLLNWLAQDHIREWLHGDDLQNTLNDLDKFFKDGSSIYEHWIAYNNGIPFGYLITSVIDSDPFDEDDHLRWYSEEGPMIDLNVFICEKKFIDKGLDVPMIQQFLMKHFSHVAEVLATPELTNIQAIQVYKKAGFESVGESVTGGVRYDEMHLNLKKLIRNKRLR